MTDRISRSAFVAAAAAAGAATLAARPARSQTPAEVPLQIAIDPAATGRPIPPDFLGLSFESELLADPTFFNADNPSVVGLVRRLGSGGILRLGGSSVDRVTFSNEAPPAGTGRIAIGPSDVSRLAAFLNAAGWRASYGVDFARSTPNDAATEAARVAGTLGARLAGFSIGDEPDRYVETAQRPAGYGYAEWFKEWSAFASAVGLRAPAARIGGPDASASSDWVARFARDQRGASPLSVHVFGAGAGTAAPTIDRLLAFDPAPDALFSQLAAVASASNAALRVTELNTSAGAGTRGVSDTFTAALWTVDMLFRIAAAGGAGANLHAPRDGANAPWITDQTGTREVRPLYYGLLFFALAGRGSLVLAQPSRPALNLGAYAVRAADGTATVALINKDAAQDARVTIDAGRALGRVSVMRLRAPAIDSIRGTTLGGVPIGRDGSWTPGSSERVAPVGTTAAVRVPFASAALVTLG